MSERILIRYGPITVELKRPEDASNPEESGSLRTLNDLARQLAEEQLIVSDVKCDPSWD